MCVFCIRAAKRSLVEEDVSFLVDIGQSIREHVRFAHRLRLSRIIAQEPRVIDRAHARSVVAIVVRTSMENHRTKYVLGTVANLQGFPIAHRLVDFVTRIRARIVLEALQVHDQQLGPGKYFFSDAAAVRAPAAGAW